MLGKLILFLISGFLILGTGCSRTEGGKDITGKEEMQPETENTGDTEQNTTVTENSEEKEQTPGAQSAAQAGWDASSTRSPVMGWVKARKALWRAKQPGNSPGSSVP